MLKYCAVLFSLFFVLNINSFAKSKAKSKRPIEIWACTAQCVALFHHILSDLRPTLSPIHPVYAPANPPAGGSLWLLGPVSGESQASEHDAYLDLADQCKALIQSKHLQPERLQEVNVTEQDVNVTQYPEHLHTVNATQSNDLYTPALISGYSYSKNTNNHDQVYSDHSCWYRNYKVWMWDSLESQTIDIKLQFSNLKSACKKGVLNPSAPRKWRGKGTPLG